jgi:hypothetical protein
MRIALGTERDDVGERAGGEEFDDGWAEWRHDPIVATRGVPIIGS